MIDNDPFTFVFENLFTSEWCQNVIDKFEEASKAGFVESRQASENAPRPTSVMVRFSRPPRDTLQCLARKMQSFVRPSGMSVTRRMTKSLACLATTKVTASSSIRSKRPNLLVGITSGIVKTAVGIVLAHLDLHLVSQ